MNGIVCEKQKDRSSIYICFIISFLNIALILKGAPYFYVIPILAISSNYKGLTYLISNLISLILSFLISINNGYEMIIICASFFLFKMIANFYIKTYAIKRMFPYVLTNLLLFIMYFVKSISFVNFSNLFLAFSCSFLIFYALHKILDNYQYSKNVIDSKDRIIIYTIIPIIFEGIPLFYLFFVRLIHLFLIKCSKFSEALAAVVLTSFYFAYFLNMSQIDILLLILPFLFSFMLSKKYSILVYGIFYIISNIFILENFYINPNFYQGLTAILLGLLIPESLFDNLKKILTKEDEIVNENIDSEKIENIISYLSLVLDSSLENIKDPFELTYEELNKSLCKTCERKENCNLKNIIKKGIKDKYEKEERKKILDDCLYPFKLFKKTIVISDIYKDEVKKINENKTIQNLYKKEVENLYYPLIENKKDILIENIIKELNEEGLKVIDVKKYEHIIDVELTEYHLNDEEIIITILEDLYKKSFAFINKKYSFSLGGYILTFSCQKKYDIKISSFIKSYSEDVLGDKISYSKDDSKFVLLLSDGMGHNKKSESLSNYLVESLLAYRKLDDNYIRQMETINRLLYQKSSVEMYATLDYFVLDLVNLNFTLLKAGSFPTFIYHEGKLKESKKNFTPLGILEKIEPFAYKDVLSEGDIIIFMSDGFGNDVYDVILKVMNENKEEELEKLTAKLKDELIKNEKVKDDKSLVLIKIEKCV